MSLTFVHSQFAHHGQCVRVQTWWGTNAGDGSLYPHLEALSPPIADPDFQASYTIVTALFQLDHDKSVWLKVRKFHPVAGAHARAPIHGAHVFEQNADPADDVLNSDVFWVLASTVAALVDMPHACCPSRGTCIVVVDPTAPGGKRRRHDLVDNSIYWLNPFLPPRRAEAS